MTRQIPCKCGCGTMIDETDKRGRRRSFVRGHSSRGRRPASTGANHHAWKADQKLFSSHGYIKVRVGKAHPLADPNGYAYEHLVIWVSAGNPRPILGEVLHHISGEKTDNRIENLELTTRGDHNRHHNTDKARNERGQFEDASAET